MSKPSQFDKPLILIVFSLITIGIVMIYSSSAIYASDHFSDTNHFLYRQIVWTLIGIILMLGFFNIDYMKMKYLIYSGMFFCFLSLVFVLIPAFSVEINGSRRWLSLGFVNFQPSEFTKLILTMYFAFILSKKHEQVKEFNFTIAPLLLLTSVFFGLILLELDLGTVLIILAILFSMLFIAEAKIKHISLLILGMLPFFYVFIWNVGYRRERIISFLHPENDPLNTGFQIIQSKIAIGTGGLSGLGIGNGLQKLYYLPEAHNDFIYSVLCEEMGFIGGFLVILLFGLFIWRGIKIALKAPNYFGYLLAISLTIMIGIQAFINIAVVMGLFPTKGLALPFLSFGGSSLLANLTAIGILLNISSKSKLNPKPEKL